MIALLLLIPTLCGGLAFVLRSDSKRQIMLLMAAAAHVAITTLALLMPITTASGSWFGLDALGRLFLGITSVLFLASSASSVGYLRTHQGRQDIYVGCMLFFLAAMTLVTVSQHFGALWIAIEATTLASAPLIYFSGAVSSLEAMWKYLLLCSVGIALALLGNFFLAAAFASDGQAPMSLTALRQGAGASSQIWLQAAFICFVVGYGTKMGLAPMHSWLPDAHSESPSPVSALLSGALLNCAFLGILRALQVCASAGIGDFARDIMLDFGLLSMAFAAVFIVRQPNFKRLLAYSSIEHMGILALGIGIGGGGDFGALLHAVNHSLTKAMLFLLAGNIIATYHTKSAGRVTAMLRTIPITGALWVAGLLAITGSPPFGPFLSELTILQASLSQERFVVAALYLALLALIFIAMADVCMKMAQGDPSPGCQRRKESLWTLAPTIALGIGVLTLGVYVPHWLDELLRVAAQSLEGTS